MVDPAFPARGRMRKELHQDQEFALLILSRGQRDITGSEAGGRTSAANLDPRAMQMEGSLG
jgi:hypothetical protein